jgi:predicted enzyme related to lactoylglutathione lyase
MTEPTTGHGKITYLELPASDIQASATFYQEVFGWNVRTRGDGAVAFDDGVGEVSGTWSIDRKAVAEPGMLLYISADDAVEVSSAIERAGGSIVQPADSTAVDIVATFRDPAGNLLGIHQYKPENAS